MEGKTPKNPNCHKKTPPNQPTKKLKTPTTPPPLEQADFSNMHPQESQFLNQI